MGLASCEKCWETTCCCGWGYVYMSDKKFEEFIKDITEGRKRYKNQDRSKRCGYLKSK